MIPHNFDYSNQLIALDLWFSANWELIENGMTEVLS
jgi:hypothetical protein